MKISVTDLLGNTLGMAVNQTAIAAITGYQKYVSPHKGFSCAYRVLHHSDSCSQHIKNLIAKYGMIEAIPLARKRLKACKNAYIILKSETKEERRRRQSRSSDQSNWDCTPGIEDCCIGCDEPDCDVCDCGSN